MDTLINKIPDIIIAAAKSNLGIFALLCIAISVLAYLFFKDASEPIKVLIFLLLLFGVFGFGTAIFKVPGVAPNPTTPPDNGKGSKEIDRPDRFELVKAAEGDCHTRALTIKDRYFGETFEIRVFNNCRYIDWNSVENTLKTISLATGLADSEPRWVLINYSPGFYEEGGCDNRIFFLFDKKEKRRINTSVSKNCDTLNFNKLPWELAKQIVKINSLE